MTAPDAQPGPASAADTLLAAEDVLGELIDWHRAGSRVALVTLVGIDGATPRPLGAQLAVAADGRFTGYLSGGCIEAAIALEARQSIAEGRNRLVRYGEGSAYLDLKLPCGSGLDLYFDQGLDGEILDGIASLRAARAPFVLATDLGTGASRIERVAPARAVASSRTGDVFYRTVLPPMRVLLVGGGPALAAIARLVAATGFPIDIVSPDDAARGEIAALGLEARRLVDAAALDLTGVDAFTAAVVAFHEHDWEAPVLARILERPCFYIGVMGSRTAHANRSARITALGVSAEQLARLKSPIGTIPGAKSRATLAVGILADIVAEAKAAGFVP